MSNVLLHAASYALNSIWLVTVFWAAAKILCRVVKRAGPEVEHGVWVASLLLGFFSPLVPVLWPGNGLSSSLYPPVSAPMGSVTALLSGSGSAHSTGTLYAVGGIYCAALIFFCVRLGWLVRRTRSMIRGAGPVHDERSLALWRRTQEKFSARTVSLRSSTIVTGPAVAGLREAVLLLPDSFAGNCSETEFLAAVGHECAHIERGDFWKNLIYESVSVFTAFHPLTWATKSELAQTRETICDDIAASRVLDRRTYAASLLQLASRMTSAGIAPAIGMFDSNSLERRIMTLISPQPRLSAFRRHVTKSAAILFLLGCATASWPLAQSIAAQSSEFAQALRARMGAQELTCTFYDAKGKASPGTCWLSETELNEYRCYLNENPSVHQHQTGCEWKVQRALKAGK